MMSIDNAVPVVTSPVIPVEEAFSEYTTKDFNIAAFIWCQPGAELSKYYNANEQSKNVLYFVFRLPISDKEREILLFDYYNSRTTVETKAFIAAQSKLKDLIHASK